MRRDRIVELLDRVDEIQREGTPGERELIESMQREIQTLQALESIEIGRRLAPSGTWRILGTSLAVGIIMSLAVSLINVLWGHPREFIVRAAIFVGLTAAAAFWRGWRFGEVEHR